MKKIFVVCLMFLGVFLVGCGKKKQKVVKEVTQSSSVVKKLNSSDKPEGFVFDDSVANVEEFSFVEEDNNPKTLAQSSTIIDDDPFFSEDAESLKSKNLNEEFEKIRFGFDSDQPIKGSDEALHKDIQLAKKKLDDEDKELEIRAYCCEIGAADYNMALSQRRANAIKKEMVAHGISEKKINAIGCGQGCPVAWSNSTERLSRIKELSPNRRAEFAVRKSS